jgi:hypothetical protein
MNALHSRSSRPPPTMGSVMWVPGRAKRHKKTTHAHARGLLLARLTQYCARLPAVTAACINSTPPAPLPSSRVQQAHPLRAHTTPRSWLLDTTAANCATEARPPSGKTINAGHKEHAREEINGVCAHDARTFLKFQPAGSERPASSQAAQDL